MKFFCIFEIITLIKELKQMVDVPVVGNGDITTPEDARNMLSQTGCDQ